MSDSGARTSTDCSSMLLREEGAGADANGIIDRLLKGELAAIDSAVKSANIEQCLASLSERGIAANLVRQQYTGRYPFELLQNASDAASKASTSHRGTLCVRFLLTRTALIVANMGAGFSEQNVRAICGLGRTSKDPRDETIGHKGLGFKSVGEITDSPQIVSGELRFTFDEQRARRAIQRRVGSDQPIPRIPSYAFPFHLDLGDLGEDRAAVEECIRQGYVTVLRLPFRSGVDRRQVERHLVETLSPQVVMLLDSVDELIVDGVNRPFHVARAREKKGGFTHVVLQVNGGALEDWLLFERFRDIPDRGLVSKLDDGWSKVTKVRVSAAIPLLEGKPNALSAHPIHVYFPTEDTSGFAFIVHADFALTMDRRHVSPTPEAEDYNRWLAEELVRLVAEDVVRALCHTYGNHPSVVAVLAPDDQPNSPFGRRLRKTYIDALRGRSFVPTVDGSLVPPATTYILPDSAGDPVTASEHLNLPAIGHMVTPEVQANARARRLLHTDFKVPQLTTEKTLAILRSNPPQPAPFYRWLNRWASKEDIESFAGLLQTVSCVHTTKRMWVRPSEEVYFPRERGAPNLPSDLPLCIADVPENVRPLLQRAGVSDFRWREVVLSSILPILTDRRSSDERRGSAHKALRAYFESEGGKDGDITARVGAALVPAVSAAGRGSTLRPASDTYFSAAWLGHDRLNRIYGRFNEPEFLDWPPPASPEERANLRKYLEWLGVAPRPRVDRTSIPHLPDHTPASDLWRRWMDASSSALACPMTHPRSNRSGQSYALDRFEKILGSARAEPLRCLFQELAGGCAAYSDAWETLVRCSHTSHKGADERPTPSLLHFALRESSWVPAVRGGVPGLYAPNAVWLSSGDVPRKVLALLPTLEQNIGEGAALLGLKLGMVDGARADDTQLIGALRLLADDASRPGLAVVTEEVVQAARWLMRHLNDALADGELLPDGKAPPLLATKAGTYQFVVQPYVADDPMVADLWRDRLPILAADRELKRLHRAFGLRDLKREAKMVPRPSGPDCRKSEDLRARLHEASPYLIAVATDATPSQAENIRGRLGRVDISACARLTVECSLDGGMRFEHPVTTHLAVRIEASRASATIHVDVAGEPDLYSMGRNLAEFLETPSQGDAFALILKGGESDRRSYLASRRIPLSRVEQEARLLSELPGLSRGLFEELLEPAPPAQPPQPAPEAKGASAQREAGVAPNSEQPVPDRREPRSTVAPSLDPEGIRGYEVTKRTPSSQPTRGDVTSLRHPTGQGHSRDWEQEEADRRDAGRRGELAAFEFERRRVQLVGFDRSVVVWQSNLDEVSPYDIRSVDDDGQTCYIEVKSTASSDESAEFDISKAELLWALAHGERYKIYRVVDVYSSHPRVYCYRNIPDRLREGGDIHLGLGVAKMRLPRYVSADASGR